MAPGSAVLQHRRRRQRQHVDSGRSGAARIDAGIRRGLASRAVADAAHVHGQGGEVVSGRQPCGPARHRSRSRGVPDPPLGARARRHGVLPDAHAACVGRHAEPPARVLDPLCRRRYPSRAAPLENVARFPRARGATARRRAARTPAVSGRVVAWCGAGRRDLTGAFNERGGRFRTKRPPRVFLCISVSACDEGSGRVAPGARLEA
ncbi:hypothetical protein EMIT0111MI5_20272 [Burkholderia sp. IT-111MI5]